MKTSTAPIFEPAAAQKILASQERQVFPRVIRGKAFAALWLALALLLAGIAAISLVNVPIYAPGQAVLLLPDVQAEAGDPAPHLIVFLAPEISPFLRPGQQVVLKTGAEASPLQATILSVEAGAMTIEQARQKYSLGESPPSLPRLTAIATARLAADAPPPDAVHQAQVRLGSKRLIAFLPGMGQQTGE